MAITGQAMANATTDYTINDLIAYKQSHGMSATVVTLEDIYANYAGVDQPEQIRNFIIDAYNNWETDYVLLGGDSNIVPCRSLWVDIDLTAANSRSPATSTTSVWTAISTATATATGEKRATGQAARDVDLSAEVYIGRVPADDRRGDGQLGLQEPRLRGNGLRAPTAQRHDGRRVPGLRRRFGICHGAHGGDPPGQQRRRLHDGGLRRPTPTSPRHALRQLQLHVDRQPR